MATPFDMQTSNSKVSQELFVRDPFDLRFVSHACFVEFVLDVEDILECRPLASTHSMTGTNEELELFTLFHPFDGVLKMGIGLGGVEVGTY